MDVERITGLRADIVPHREWPVRKWFYANPLWYYHRRGQDNEVIANRKFFSLVDPDLRQVCHLLNSAGLVTTPSCQGHFYDQKRFEDIWTVLKREEMLIQADGLIVKDSETDREFRFHDPDYVLAWKSFEDFYSEAADHQGTGYLGILIVPEHAEMAERFRQPYKTAAAELSEDQELGRQLGGDMFQLIVHTSGPAERSEEWRRFTEWVRDLLKPDVHVAAR
jgi:hypothetical protein